jgi:hypothetical protein
MEITEYGQQINVRICDQNIQSVDIPLMPKCTTKIKIE